MQCAHAGQRRNPSGDRMNVSGLPFYRPAVLSILPKHLETIHLFLADLRRDEEQHGKYFTGRG